MKKLISSFLALAVFAGTAVHCARSTEFLYRQPTPPPTKTETAGPGHLEGQITDPLGHPINDVALIVHGKDGVTETRAHVRTNSAGHYTITDLEPGTYNVDFTQPSYKSIYRIALTVIANRATVFNLVMTKVPGSLSGRVIEAVNGVGLNGVWVQVHMGDSTTPVLATAQTDTNGNYSVPGLTEGNYSVDFSLTAYVPVVGVPTIIRAGQDTRLNQTLLSTLGSLRGRVTSAVDGSNLQNVLVEVRGTASASPVATVQTDARGNYVVLDLPEGAFSVTFSLANYTPVTHAVNIFPSQTTTLNVQLGSSLGILRGEVTNAISGQPLPGVMITVHMGGAVVGTAQTDYRGSYQIGAVPAGAVTVDFTLDGYIPIMAVPAMMRAGQTTVLDESLTKALAAGEFRITLNWTREKSGAVRDVDTYLAVPNGRVYALQFNYLAGDGAQIDVDDTDWAGPETTTIMQLRQGTYTYYINNYDARCYPTYLGDSEVIVRVYDHGGLQKTYTLKGGSGLTYEVFKIVNGQVVDVLKYNDSLRTEGSPCPR